MAKKRMPSGESPKNPRAMSEISQAVLRRIHEAREAKGMTQGEVMTRASLYDQWFSKRANGTGEISVRDVVAIAAAIGVPVESLLGLTPVPVGVERPLDPEEKYLISLCYFGTEPVGPKRAGEILMKALLDLEADAGRSRFGKARPSIARDAGEDTTTVPKRKKGPGRPPLGGKDKDKGKP